MIRVDYSSQFKISLIFLLIVFFLSQKVAIGQASIDELETISLNIGHEDLDQSAEYYTQKAYKYLYQDSFLLALEFASKAEKKATIENDNYSLASQYNIKGHVHLNYGAYVKAISNFSKSEKLSTEYSFNKILLNAKYGLGLTYNSLGKYEVALLTLEDGLEIAKKSDDPRDLAIIYNALGRTLQDNNDPDSSLVFLRKYLHISKSINDSLYISYALINIGESYRALGDTSSAMLYYKEAEIWNSSINNVKAKAAIYGNLAIIFTLRKEYKKAINYYKKSVDLSYNNKGLSSYLLLDLRSIAKNYENIGQHDSAYYYFKEYVLVSDSVMKNDHQKKLSTLHYSQVLTENDNKAKILKQKLYSRTITIGFITVLIILIILLLTLMNSRNKLVTKKNTEKVKSLNLALDKKNRELITSLIDDKLLNDLMEEVNYILSEIEVEGKMQVNYTRILDIETKLRRLKVASLAWNSFKLQFEQVHPDFFNNLNKLSSQLTTNDIRYCAYLKLKLSSSDIAEILNISTKAAQATKLRIAKKLGVLYSTDLIVLIESV